MAIRLVLSALAAAGALGVSGCGGGGDGQAPAERAATETAPSDAVGTVATESAPPPADDLDQVETREAGDDGVATLKASAPPVPLEVELRELVDPVPSTSDFSPQRDNRFVAARIAFTNGGDASYTDTPSSGMALVDAQGREHPAAVVDAAEPALGRITVGPGETASGFVTFEVPKGARLAELRIRLNSGFGPEEGVWALP